MATRYTVEALLHLRESPLCVKPTALPPPDEWMGPLAETVRNNQGIGRTGADRTRNNDGHLLEQTNRRPGVDRHAARNNANPEDINLGPPRTTFPSATLPRGNKPFDNDKNFRDPDSRGDRDRLGFRNRNGDGDNRDRDRDNTRGNFRRRAEADQDSDGWSTVKPRKSFGHEGAERFHGKFGGGDRDRRARDNHQDDNTERPPRRSNFGEFGRDRDRDRDEDGERPRRNGLHNKPWTRTNNGDNDAPPPRERFDRAKSWRERDRDDHDDKPRERNFDRERNWDHRDQRQEVEPEWLNEPADEKVNENIVEEHTNDDLKKFLRSMKANDNTAKPEPVPLSAIEPPAPDESQEPEKSEAKSAPAVASGPDKFFANFAPTPSNDTGSPLEGAKETAPPKPKTGSRFQNFFAVQNQKQTEPSAPTAGAISQEPNPLLPQASPSPAGSGAGAGGNAYQPTEEKLAFQALLQKLHTQSLLSNTPPSAGGYAAPAAPPSHDMAPKSAVASPGLYPPFAQEHPDDHLGRGYPVPGQDIHAPRPQQLSQMGQMGQMGPEQQVPDISGQRRPMPAQNPVRADQNQSRNSNNNTQFLMALMQGGGRSMPEPPRAEQVLRMPQPSRPAQIPQTPDREADYQRERSSSQQQGRPQIVPGYFNEDQLHHHEQDNRRPQPTQILQRQGGPPGLEQQMHPVQWMQGPGQQLPSAPGRPMIPPPPGLAGNPRNGPMPAMYQNFPMGGGGIFPQESMGGPPRNSMGPPPGFFGAPPPPGFIPSPAGFQGAPEAVLYGFDGRGMPPGGPYRRN